MEVKEAITDYFQRAFDWHSQPQEKVEPLTNDLYDAWARFQEAVKH